MARNKVQVCWTISNDVLIKLRTLRKDKYPGISESAVADMLLREALPQTGVSVAG